MIPAFKYRKPAELKEVLEHLGQDGAMVVAGGTDLVIALKKRSANPQVLIDITGVEALKCIRLDKNIVHIGPATSFTAVANSALLRKRANVLAEAAQVVGSPQIRNRGTIGGNIANGSPAADTVPALVALEASITLQSRNGKRTMPVTELLDGLGKGLPANGEMITDIMFSLPAETARSCFVKLGRRNALAISRLSMALIVSLPADGRIGQAAMALGAVAPHPVRVPEAEALLLGQLPAADIFDQTAAGVSRFVQKTLGNRASAPYKERAVCGVAKEALAKLFPGIYC